MGNQEWTIQRNRQLWENKTHDEDKQNTKNTTQCRKLKRLATLTPQKNQ